MRPPSPITWLFQKLALCCACLAPCFAENAAAQSRPFVNISTRAEVLNGQDTIVAGFIIQTTASTTKTVLIRGLGPSAGLSLADPTITLNGPNGPIYTNNNWKDDVNQQNAIAATGFQPGNDSESAILWTLPAGSYTITLGGNNGATGVGLVELYDMGGAAPIVNLSSRARVGTGDNVMIGGVYVQDGTRAVVRAIGPALTNYGIQGALANPVLELYDGQGTPMTLNDNWQSDPQWPEIQRLGLAPADGLESAILPTLAPGPYTVIVRGADNGTGIGMVELYALADAKYPRIFQPWGEAEIPGEERNAAAARHDLFWSVDFGFGWRWVDGNGVPTQDYQSETIQLTDNPPIYSVPTLRSLNPNIKLLVQVSLYSLAADRLPATHPWWKHDAAGNRIPEGGGYLLDPDNSSLRAHVASQAAALMQTGQFDGVMLDECRKDTLWLLPVVTAVRNAIGENGLIIVNANANQLSAAELAQINGQFVEAGIPGTSGYATWQAVKNVLDNNETLTRTPRINCLETWFVTSRTSDADMKRMRATTCLSLTHSDGYAVFSDPNSLPTLDHLHNFYDFWSNHRLGVPTGTRSTINNIADRKDYQNGSAIWNASATSTVSVTFSQPRKSLATGAIGQSFSVPASDGDIFIINY